MAALAGSATTDDDAAVGDEGRPQALQHNKEVVEEEEEEPEWEDQYGREESQGMEDDIAPLPPLLPTPPLLSTHPPSPQPTAISTSTSLSSAPTPQREWLLIDDDDEEHSAAPSPPLAPAVHPSSPSPPPSPSALSLPPFPLQWSPELPSMEEEGEEEHPLHRRSAKRRRVVLDDSQEMDFSSVSLPSRSPSPAPPPSLSSSSPRLPLRPSASPTTASISVDIRPRSPSISAQPSVVVASPGPLLSFDVAAFLSTLPPVDPSPPPPPPLWSPPPSPYSFSDYSDSLPTFDLGPSTSRVSRQPRPLKTLPPHLRLHPLIAPIDLTTPPLTSDDSVQLFGSTYEVSAFPQHLLTSFAELQWRLGYLLQATTSEEVGLSDAQRWVEEIHHFLTFLLAYVDCVLPSLMALERCVLLHVLETSLMALSQVLLCRRLPVYDVLHCRSGRGVYCCALYAHLMTHSTLITLHSAMLSCVAALPRIPAVRTLSSPSPMLLPPVCSRWSFQSYTFYLIHDLLRLHLSHPGIGGLPFSVYHTLPSSSDGRHTEALHELRKDTVGVYQPVLALWRCLITYTDHLSEAQHRESPQPRRWSAELGFCLCTSAEVEEQRLLLDRFDSLRPVVSREVGVHNEDEFAMAIEGEMGEVFPCFYSLLNLCLEAFILNSALSSASTSPPLPTVAVPSFPGADLIQRCLHPEPGFTSPETARGIRERVEALWEVLIDVIVPCYSLLPQYAIAKPLSAVDVMTLCSSYSLYEGPSPPPIPPLALQRHATAALCACRPHWSLVFLLLRVGTGHVQQEWRPLYSRHTLDRLCSLIHVWPCIHIEPLILNLHSLCGLDSDFPAPRAPRPTFDLHLSSLEHWAPFLFADVVSVPIHRSHSDDDSLWCRYLQLLYIFLRQVAESQRPSSTDLSSRPLCHNNFHHHSLLFYSTSTSLNVISSFYHLFPKPTSLSSCSADHSQLDVAAQVASLHLLASLVSEEEARLAHIHLEKLIDWRSSRCYHAHCLLLHCWASLLSMRIERRMDTGDAIQRFNEVLSHVTQQLLDEEEDIEQLQCAVWTPPRDWSDEDRRSRATELQRRRSEVEGRRRHVVEGVALQRRLLGKKREVEGILGGDCVLLIGEVMALTVPLCFTLDSQSIVLDLLRMDRAVILPLRQQALLIVQLIVRDSHREDAPSIAPIPQSSEQGDGSGGEGSQDSQEMEVLAEVSRLEAEALEQKRLLHLPSFLRFLSTAHRLLLEAIQVATDPTQQDSALLLLNPHRADLMAKVTQDAREMEAYRRTKRDNRSSKAQYRRPGSRSMDDGFRIDRPTLLTCIRLYADISHVLLARSERLTSVALLTSFGRVCGNGQVSTSDVGLLPRYLPLFMWDAFLSSRVKDARQAIDRVLSKEVDRCHLLHDVLSAMIDPAVWRADALTPLPTLLTSVLTHPAFRRYQMPLVDPSSQCSSMERLREHRKDVVDRLFCGIGELYQLTSSDCLRDLFPSLLLQLAGHHDRVVQRVLSSRPHSDRSPPVLDAASRSYIEWVYQTLTSLFRHCLPLLHPRQAKDGVPLDGILTTFYEKVISTERSGGFTTSFVLPPSTSTAHQEMALATWPTLLYSVDRLHIDPLGKRPTGPGEEGSTLLPLSIRALVAAIKKFWPSQVSAAVCPLTADLPLPTCCAVCLTLPSLCMLVCW